MYQCKKLLGILGIVVEEILVCIELEVEEGEDIDMVLDNKRIYKVMGQVILKSNKSIWLIKEEVGEGVVEEEEEVDIKVIKPKILIVMMMKTKIFIIKEEEEVAEFL